MLVADLFLDVEQSVRPEPLPDLAPTLVLDEDGSHRFWRAKQPCVRRIAKAGLAILGSGTVEKYNGFQSFPTR